MFLLPLFLLKNHCLKKLVPCKLKKNKNKLHPVQKNDSFDVKKNLSKLRAFGDKNSSSPTEDIFSEILNKESTYTSSDNQASFEQTTFQEIKHLNNKINSDIRGLEGQFHSTKENLNAKITSEIESVNAKFEKKLDEKIDNKYFFGAIAVLIMLVGIIATLSYYPLIQDVEELKNKDIEIKDSLNKINNRIDKLKMIDNNKKR